MPHGDGYASIGIKRERTEKNERKERKDAMGWKGKKIRLVTFPLC